MKLSDEETEKLMVYSLRKNRERRRNLLDSYRECRQIADEQSQNLYQKNLEIAKIKTQRAVFAVLAAAGIGYSVVDAIIDARRAQHVNQIHIEPVSSMTEH